MDEVIARATFAGAWLLVAGPLYQGSVQLSEQDVDREGIQGKATGWFMRHVGGTESSPAAEQR